MKKLLLLAFIIAFSCTASAIDALQIKVISEEINSVNGKFNLQLKYLFKDKTVLSSVPQIELPDKNWTANNTSVSPTSNSFATSSHENGICNAVGTPTGMFLKTGIVPV